MSDDTTLGTLGSQDCAAQLKVLADSTRLAVARRLLLKPLRVGELRRQLGVEQSLLSHHLRVLRQAGIIENKKMCRDVFYWIKPSESKAIIEALEKILSGK